MNTTAPSSRDEGSTKLDALVSFDEDRWLDQAPANGGHLSSIPPAIAASAHRTTRESFELPDILYRRYSRDWPQTTRPRFILKHEWIGRVDELHDDSFLATLVTRSAPYEIEHAEIELEEVTPSDRIHLRPGAVFYWVIGYRDEPYGQRVGVSSILVRKMSEPTLDQLQHAEAEAERALTFLAGWDKPSPTE